MDIIYHICLHYGISHRNVSTCGNYHPVLLRFFRPARKSASSRTMAKNGLGLTKYHSELMTSYITWSFETSNLHLGDCSAGVMLAGIFNAMVICVIYIVTDTERSANGWGTNLNTFLVYDPEWRALLGLLVVQLISTTKCLCSRMFHAKILDYDFYLPNCGCHDKTVYAKWMNILPTHVSWMHKPN